MTTPAPPDWLFDLLRSPVVAEGEELEASGQTLVRRDGILRLTSLVSDGQAQTAESFGFKWDKRDTFESESSLARMREWLIERYGDVENADWWADYGAAPFVLDAGCGAAMSSLELFGRRFDKMRYVGADISNAVDVAAQRVAQRGFEAGFVQADLMALPFPPGSIDVVFSEGVLHHTDSTKDALKTMSRLLAPGGRFLFYVYRRKGPIREFTDDHVREVLQPIPPQEAWDKLMPLTKLGKLLGDLQIEVEVPEPIDLLGIPAGPIDLQRLFYWHVVKAYHHPDLTLDELNHINYDWFAPRNAHRQSPDEVRSWCAEAGLSIERERVEEAGITIVARKAS